MPSKHINFSQSLLGFGSYILSKINRPTTIDDIWKVYQSDLQNELYSAKHSFDNLILTLIFLYSVNAINEKNGLILKCD